MIIHQRAEKLHNHLKDEKEKGRRVGFVPTMGALHEGHISLIRQAVENSDLVTCSIFVNPTQFNDPKDFARYPATLGSDLDLLYGAGVAAVFVPRLEDIYPGGTDVENSFDLDGLDKRIEGKFRPGHFQGVCQVVFRLLDIVRPHTLFMGQKDYQQCMVIRKMLEVKDLPTELVICPTVRENSGLAMSSRNMRLTAPQKSQAALIYKVLSEIKEGIRSGRFEWLKNQAIQELTNGGFIVDYIEIVNAVNLSEVEDGDLESPLVALAAAFLGEVRLIDNLVVR
jgi:pantoate--beta-alanine ligase